jgi:hypothetical protein
MEGDGFYNLLNGRKFYSDMFQLAETSLLHQKWYLHWTGKYRYRLHCSFPLLTDGNVKDISIEAEFTWRRKR